MPCPAQLPALPPLASAHGLPCSGFGAPTPFCAYHGRLEDYLRRAGFVAEDKLTFRSGAYFQRYRYLGDMLWIAHWPDGKSCLIANGLLKPSWPSPH